MLSTVLSEAVLRMAAPLRFPQARPSDPLKGQGPCSVAPLELAQQCLRAASLWHLFQLPDL